MAKRKSKLKFEDVTKLVTEDATVQADKWATGVSGRYHRPQQLTLIDLLKKQDDQHPNYVRAPQGMPHSAQMMVELVGEAVLKVEQIRAALRIAQSNPIIAENKKAQLRLDTIINKTKRIMEIVKSIGTDIDGFSIVPDDDGAGRSPWASRKEDDMSKKELEDLDKRKK
jgi:hypothetical protein